MRSYIAALIFTIVLGAVGLGNGQSVGTLRQATWALPANEKDNAVIGWFFSTIHAVQTPCSNALQNSLASESALAACGSFTWDPHVVGSLTRSAVDYKSSISGRWVSPWQANADFGNVRRLEHKGTEYHLAIDDRSKLAYVIRFED